MVAEQQVAVNNLAELVGVQARIRPDEPAVLSADERLTWADLEQRIDAAATGLTAAGLLAGQRVGVPSEPTPAFVVDYLACLQAGLIVVPLPAAATDEERVALLRTVGGHELPTDRAAHAAGSRAGSPPDPQTPAVLLQTSGSSGDSRPVVLSHRALLAHLDAAAAYGITGPDTTIVAALPLSHVFGLNTVLGGWLRCGGRLVLVDGGAAELLAAVAKHAVTILPVTPRLLADVMRVPDYAAQLGSVRTVLSAAAPLPWRLAQEFGAATGLRVDQGYGLTEAASGVSTTIGHPILGPAHVGRVLPGVEVRIGSGGSAVLEPGEPGPILIRGDNLFSGYWPELAPPVDDGGWFDTGDVGYLAGDDLFLVDRSAEQLVVGGFTVHPGEVEQTVRELDGVDSAGAVAVGGVDGSGPAERLVLFVAGDVDEAAVAAFCAAELPAYKRPAEIRLVDDLPRGVTGKVRRGVLRRWAEEGMICGGGTDRG